MIELLSRKIVQYLLNEKVINNTKDEKDYYQYGIEILISSIFNIVLILFLGMILRCALESLIFLALFIPIRQFTGGFHASSYFKCNLTFCICFTIVIICYMITYEEFTTYIAILIALICTLIIFMRCPVENPNKPITERKKFFHKIVATIMAFGYGVLSVALLNFSNKYGVLVLYTLSLVTVLIIVVIFQERRCKNEKRKKGKRCC